MAAAGGEGVEKLEDMIVRAAEATAGHVAAAKAAIGNVIFGQEKVVEQTLITVLCGGHGMLVGVPGLAKTKLVEALGTVLGLDARRIQFTPDLMPSDILGSEVLEEGAGGKRADGIVVLVGDRLVAHVAARHHERPADEHRAPDDDDVLTRRVDALAAKRHRQERLQGTDRADGQHVPDDHAQTIGHPGRPQPAWRTLRPQCPPSAL